MKELKERIPEAGTEFRNLVMAESSKADTYAAEVHKIMTAIGLERYFISDMSTFGDLPVDDLSDLAVELGVESIADGDYVAEIAEKMHNLTDKD